MKGKRFFALLLCAALLAGFFGCLPLTDPEAANRVYTISGDVMTDGTTAYQRLYSENGWGYSGKYPYKIGSVKGGNVLLASDETGVVVQERKNFLQDMDYRPWIRSDTVFPDPFGEDCHMAASIFTVKDVSLSDEAKAEVLACRSSYLTSSGIHGKTTDKPFGCLYFESNAIPGLYYDPDYTLVESGDRICIVNNYSIVGSFGPDTAFYREIAANR